jgi:hypothetical protein
MSDAKRSPVMTGGCQCGAVRYALASEPTEPSICHCRMCQKAFCNYFAPLAGVPLEDLSWTRGTPGIFRSSEAVERGFCRDCGTPLFYRVLGKNRISVSLGSLDEPGQVKPEFQYGVESRVFSLQELARLPEETTEQGTAPELLARMAMSHQHPNQD